VVTSSISRIWVSVCVVSIGVVLCDLKKYDGPDLGECVCVVSVGIVLCDLKKHDGPEYYSLSAVF